MRIERLGMTVRGREVVLGLPQRLSVFVNLDELARWRFIELLAGAMLGQESTVRALTVALPNKQNLVIRNTGDSPLQSADLSVAQLQRMMRLDNTNFGIARANITNDLRSAIHDSLPLAPENQSVQAPSAAEIAELEASDSELQRLSNDLNVLDRSLQEAWDAIDRSLALQLEIDALNEQLRHAEASAPRRLWAQAWFARERLLMALQSLERSKTEILHDQRLIEMSDEVWRHVQRWREALATRRDAAALATTLRRSADETPSSLQGAFTRDTRSLIEHLASFEQDMLWHAAKKADHAASEFEELIDRLTQEPELALSLLPDRANAHHEALQEFHDIVGPLEPARCLRFMGVVKSVVAARAEATSQELAQAEALLREELVAQLTQTGVDYALPKVASGNKGFAYSTDEASELEILLEDFVREVRAARTRLETTSEADHVALQAAIALADASVNELANPEWITPPMLSETLDPNFDEIRNQIARATCELQTYPLRSELNEMAERRDSVLSQISHRKAALRSRALVSSGSSIGQSGPSTSKWLTMRAPSEQPNAWNEYLRGEPSEQVRELGDLRPAKVTNDAPTSVDGTAFANIRKMLFAADETGLVEVGKRSRRLAFRLPVLLNDPFAGLDSATKRVVFDWIRTGPINRQVILLTNDPEIAEWARSESVAIAVEVPSRETATQNRRVFTTSD